MPEELVPEELAEVRRRLQEAAAELRGVLKDDAGLAATVTLDQAAMGRVSRIDALQAQQVARAALRRATARLERVTAAIERFDEEPEAYPWCPRCGDCIGLGRLRAVPESVFCVRCLDAQGR
ncbi:MAG: TraR/DksA C4-type zinc finger protein [Myxococcota bacterium]|nr:TraR/DksA C4-type zinc finger protein [Myxococcota bacterium]